MKKLLEFLGPITVALIVGSAVMVTERFAPLVAGCGVICYLIGYIDAKTKPS